MNTRNIRFHGKKEEEKTNDTFLLNKSSTIPRAMVLSLAYLKNGFITHYFQHRALVNPCIFPTLH